MAEVSILIPAGGEQFLAKTVDDLLAKAAGDIEIIPVLDGAWPNPPLPDHKQLRIIHFGVHRGMRACLNAGAAIATGQWLMKIDAHCMVGEGYDEIMKKDCADNWVMTLRRWSLDAENWAIENNGKPPRDYHYLSSPYWSITSKDDYSMHGREWWQRIRERMDKPEFEVDETPSWQGSLWFMSRKHWDWLGGLDENLYGTFASEPQEIGNKTWLGGGAVMCSKKTFYCHLHKGSRYQHLWRMYGLVRKEIAEGHVRSALYWMNDQWSGRIHNMRWFVEEKFPGMPTWPTDQKEMDAVFEDARRR